MEVKPSLCFKIWVYLIPFVPCLGRMGPPGWEGDMVDGDKMRLPYSHGLHRPSRASLQPNSQSQTAERGNAPGSHENPPTKVTFPKPVAVFRWHLRREKHCHHRGASSAAPHSSPASLSAAGSAEGKSPLRLKANQP